MKLFPLLTSHNLLDGSVHPDSLADAVTRGSIVYGNATPKWDELTIGAANTFLGSDGTDLSYRTAAQVMASLSGQAGAGFSFNTQALTSVGAIGCAAITGTSTALFEGASVSIGKANTTTGTLVLYDSNSVNTITLTAPDVSAGSLTFTLPPTDGDNTNVLQTDGNGVLTWVVAGGAAANPAGSDTQVQYNDGGIFGADASFIWDDVNKRLGVGTTRTVAALDVVSAADPIIMAAKSGILSDITEVMTSNSAPSPNVVVASSEANADNRGWKALDHDNTTKWTTNATSTGSLKFDFGAGNSWVAERYTIFGPISGQATFAPKDWTFQGSNNDADWDTLDTVAGETAWAAIEERSFAFANTTAYRYYKIDITDNNGGAYLSFSILHIEINKLIAIVLKSDIAQFGPLDSDYTFEAFNGYLSMTGDLTNERGYIAGFKDLTLGQTDDFYGNTFLTLRNRAGENGAIFETTGSVDLVDFIFKHAGGQRNIRFEGRSEITYFNTAQEWQFGQPNISAGNLTAHTAMSEKGLVQYGITPYLYLHNNGHEDVDGGRESRLIFKGEQSGGEQTTLARIEVSHDGAADDQKGQIQLYTNDGNDADAPTLQLTIAADGGIHTANLKSGTDQANAGASAGELYSDTNDDNTVKIGI